jgi:hypothetical protein
MMTDKWFAFQALNALSDASIYRVAFVGIGMVIAWYQLHFAPKRLARWLRIIYLIGGLVLFVGAIVASVVVYLQEGTRL